MYDINNLEQQWRKYKRKRIAMYVGAFVMIAALSASVLYFAGKSGSKDGMIPKSDNMSFGKQDSGISASPKSLSPNVPSVASKPKTSKGFKITFSGEQKPGSRPHEENSPKKHINIQVSSKKSQLSIKDMEDRFADLKDKEDALFISRYYYDKKQYKKALKWALEANKIDSNIEESWLIFAKAKAKLGSRKEAIKVLQAYYDRSGSRKAKQLLDKIRRGKSF